MKSPVTVTLGFDDRIQLVFMFLSQIFLSNVFSELISHENFAPPPARQIELEGHGAV